MANTLVPVSKFHTIAPECTFDLQVPIGAYDGSRVGVDVPAAEALVRAVGLARAIFTASAGEQEQVQTTITGFDGIGADGTATATGSASVSKVATLHTTLHEDKSTPYQSRWPIATIDINRTRLASRVARKVSAGMSGEEAWAQYVDRAVRLGLADAAWQGLLKNPVLDPYACILYGLVGSNMALNGFPGAWLVSYVSAQIGSMYMGKRHGNKLKLSLSPFGIQPDRLVVAGLMAATQRIIKPI